MSSNNDELPNERIERIHSDLKDLESFYKVKSSSTRLQRLRTKLCAELELLDEAPFASYDQNGKIDYILLKNYLDRKLYSLRFNGDDDAKVLSFLGGTFSLELTQLIEARQRVDDLKPQITAQTLTEVTKVIKRVRADIVEGNRSADPRIALRATEIINDLSAHLEEWNGFYHDYDPLYTWWMPEPYKALNSALDDLTNTIKRVVLGIEPGDTSNIIGQPIGNEALFHELFYEWVNYTPEELIEIGEKEFKWCEAEMKKAAAELGYKKWCDALEHVKNAYVPPGSQRTLVRDLSKEATSYVQKYDLVTVPDVCYETIQTFMMSPERQKMNPFFLGGSSFIVSYPTSSMSQSDKLMSMRGNNIHFSRATVFHEMIPGHHLQYYYMSRFRSYRRMFETPFCVEGWAFYWEMVLWDKPSWPKTPENKIGMLFWRMHRCARIIFSLKYHMGLMTAQECIELLVNRVGHERVTAEGEVRRSIMGGYEPLYQAAYMLGGLQLYALRKEIVEGNGSSTLGAINTGNKMSEKDFHDSFLRANQMPIEIFRALIKNEDVEKDFRSRWRFYDERLACG